MINFYNHSFKFSPYFSCLIIYTINYLRLAILLSVVRVQTSIHYTASNIKKKKKTWMTQFNILLFLHNFKTINMNFLFNKVHHLYSYNSYLAIYLNLITFLMNRIFAWTWFWANNDWCLVATKRKTLLFLSRAKNT